MWPPVAPDPPGVGPVISTKCGVLNRKPATASKWGKKGDGGKESLIAASSSPSRTPCRPRQHPRPRAAIGQQKGAPEAIGGAVKQAPPTCSPTPRRRITVVFGRVAAVLQSLPGEKAADLKFILGFFPPLGAPGLSIQPGCPHFCFEHQNRGSLSPSTSVMGESGLPFT
ncbi:MAG: hypothetical protein CM15mP103_12870 [Gammaproteobacteria bacterium]|nr:MAG: hypothetical protein CM15mP103_12870 [Gammaproteobacteria bacterium]